MILWLSKKNLIVAIPVIVGSSSERTNLSEWRLRLRRPAPATDDSGKCVRHRDSHEMVHLKLKSNSLQEEISTRYGKTCLGFEFRLLENVWIVWFYLHPLGGAKNALLVMNYFFSKVVLQVGLL